MEPAAQNAVATGQNMAARLANTARKPIGTGSTGMRLMGHGGVARRLLFHLPPSSASHGQAIMWNSTPIGKKTSAHNEFRRRSDDYSRPRDQFVTTSQRTGEPFAGVPSPERAGMDSRKTPGGPADRWKTGYVWNRRRTKHERAAGEGIWRKNLTRVWDGSCPIHGTTNRKGQRRKTPGGPANGGTPGSDSSQTSGDLLGARYPWQPEAVRGAGSGESSKRTRTEGSS